MEIDEAKKGSGKLEKVAKDSIISLVKELVKKCVKQNVEFNTRMFERIAQDINRSIHLHH